MSTTSNPMMPTLFDLLRCSVARRVNRQARPEQRARRCISVAHRLPTSVSDTGDNPHPGLRGTVKARRHAQEAPVIRGRPVERILTEWREVERMLVDMLDTPDRRALEARIESLRQEHRLAIADREDEMAELREL
jgi:hypothetical protein